ncbi:MAG: hypothetical protein QGG87_03845, partial [Nitrospinota bacterium]|nr:hypothetical protein [Nitrospinota bacterium]
MQKEIEGLEDTSQPAFFKEGLAEKVFTSLDEDAINFIKKHEEIYKADYRSNSYREKIGLCLDDLIDEDDYQISPKRLILFEEGLTHLQLLLSISSDIEIKSFYKKIQNEKILDPDNPEHTAILEVLNLHLYKPRKKKLNPSFKIKLDFLLYLKQITTDSMKENYQILTDAKKEYRLYLDKVRSSSIQF